jgi:hypothetical protein
MEATEQLYQLYPYNYCYSKNIWLLVRFHRYWFASHLMKLMDLRKINLFFVGYWLQTAGLSLIISFWASAPDGTNALCPHQLDILPFRYIMLCHVTSCYVTSLPWRCPMGRKDVQVVRTYGIGHFGNQCPAIHTRMLRRWGIRVPIPITFLRRLVFIGYISHGIGSPGSMASSLL